MPGGREWDIIHMYWHGVLIIYWEDRRMRILAVIDMQKDFIGGALGTLEAQAILPAVRERIEEYRQAGDMVVFTRDTHHEGYLDSREGQNLPVVHCVEGTPGWEIDPSLCVGDSPVFNKPTFGSVELGQYVAEMCREQEVDSLELVGLCTDICVISNAMVIRAFAPELPISVNSRCCAGVTPQSHEQALGAMAACQVKIL